MDNPSDEEVRAAQPQEATVTDWTPEEERVARALEPDAWFNRENAFADFPDVADEVVRPSIEQAKRAISAMQPRWRDVRTDPPPLGVDLFLARRPGKAAGELYEKIGTGRYDGSGILWDWPWKTPPEFWSLAPPLPTQEPQS